MSLRFCSFFSGSTGNCTYIEYNNSAILIDVGSSLKKLLIKLDEISANIKNIKGIFITHEHIDHISGLKAMVSKFQIPIIANKNTLNEILSVFPDIETDLFIPLNTGDKACAGEFEVNSFFTPHDSIESVGYTIDMGNKKITVATDMGHITDLFYLNSIKSDIVLIEANYDELMLKNSSYHPTLKNRVSSSYGHLSNSDCAKAILKLFNNGTRKFVLAHLSKENNTPEIALNTIHTELETMGIIPNRDIELEIAPRLECSKIFSL